MTTVAYRRLASASVKRRTLLLSSALVGGVLLASPGLAQNLPVATGGGAGTTFNIGGAGGTTFTYSGGTNQATATNLDVNLNNQNRTLDYDSFNVAADHRVNFQDGVGGTPALTVVNRVTGVGAQRSFIDGRITSDANISVWLINEQGITFSQTASFSGGSLVLSALPNWNGSLTAPQFSGAPAVTSSISLVGGDPTRFIQALQGSIVAVGQTVIADKDLTAAGSVALVAGTDISFSDINSPLSFLVAAGTTLGTGVSVDGKVSGQSIRIAGGANVATAALLNIGANAVLTASANNGSIVIGTATGGGVTITPVAASAGIESAGTLETTGTTANITVTSDSLATVKGAVSATGDYVVTGATGVALGDVAVTATDILQKANGLVTITATTGDITGRGRLVLQSNAEGGAGLEALSLISTAGKVDFGSITAGATVSTSLLGGTSTNLSNVTIRSAPSITLGNVTANRLVTTNDPTAGVTTDLAATGAIILGDIATTQALDIQSTTNAVSTGGLSSTTGNITVRANAIATVKGAVSTPGDYVVTGGTGVALGDVTVTTPDILQKANGLVTITATTGDITGRGKLVLQSNAEGGAGLEALSLISTAGKVDFGSITAGATVSTALLGGTSTNLSDITVRSTPSITLGDVTANRLVTINDPTAGVTTDFAATGAIILGNVATNQALDIQSTTNAVSTGGLSSTTGNVTVRANTIATVKGAVSTPGDYVVTGGTGVALGDVAVTATDILQAADGLVTITATTGDITGRGRLILQSNADGAGLEALSLTATTGKVDFGSVTAGATVSTSLLGGTSTNLSDITLRSAPSITLGNVTANRLVTTNDPTAGVTTDLAATGDILLGDVSVTDPLFVRSTTGSITGGDLTSTGGLVQLTSDLGSVSAGRIDALTDVTLSANQDIRLDFARAQGGVITLTSANGDITGRQTSPSPLTFGRTDLTVDSESATISVTALSAVANKGVTKLGTLTAGVADTTFLAAPQISVDAREVDLTSARAFDGDVVISATRTALVSGDVTAGRDYRVTGSTVTLGQANTTPIVQSARGAVIITANLNNVAQTGIRGLGALSLRSNTVTAAAGGTDALSLLAANSAINFDSTTKLFGGETVELADVLIDTGSTITLGDVTALSLRDDGIATTDLTATENIQLGNVIVRDSLFVRTTPTGSSTTDGSITGGDLTSTGGLVQLTSDLGSISAGRIDAFTDVTLSANQDIRLDFARARGGAITLTATDGDITGRQTSASPLTFGRTELTVDSEGAAISVTALSAIANRGVAKIGPLTAGVDDATFLAAPQITVDAREVDLTSARGFDGDVVISATRTALVSSDVTAGRDYRVTGSTVTLGEANTTPVIQSARGAVVITANLNNVAQTGIRGLGALSLRSNNVTAAAGGTDALSLLAANSAINFDSTTKLFGGVAVELADVLIDTGSTLTLGDVTAFSLRDDGVGTTDLTAPGSITLGKVDVRKILRASTTNGSITTGDITVRDAGEQLGLYAAGANRDILTGELRTNGGDILLSATRDISVGTVGTALTGTPANGTIALLAGRNVLSATSLTAGEDIAISAGGDVTLRAVTAGDDVAITTPTGTLLFSPALTGPTPYNVETTGLGSGTRLAAFGTAGLVGGISFGAESGADGSNIRIRAANLQPGLGGSGGTGLIVNTLSGGSFDIDATTGDVRLGTLTATGGNIDIDAGGSVTGLATSYSAPTGGASFRTVGNLLLNVTGTASIGSVSAVDVRTQTNTPTALRIGNITATGALDLRTGSTLEIGTGTVTGAVTLRTASGGPAPLTDFNADPLVPNFGAANLFANATNAAVTVGAGLAAQLGTVEANQNITVSAQGVEIARDVDADHATAGGTISILARTGRAHFGRGTAGNDILLNAATNARFDIGITQSGSIAILAGGTVLSKTGTTDANNLASLTAAEDIAISAGGDVTLRAVKAGDDVGITTPTGTLLFSPALTGPTPYNAETTGLGSGVRLASFATAGQAGAISFGAESVADGSNIRIRAANLQPNLGGTNGIGLIVNNLNGNSFDIDATTGDVRLGTLTANAGNIDIDAAGSVTGLAASYAAPTGGASFRTVGNLLLNVTGTAAIGSVSAVDVRTQTNTPTSLRIRNITATGALDLRTGSTLEIGTGTVTGTVTLRTASGSPETLTNFDADPLVPNFGAANLSANTTNALVEVTAGLAAQLGTVEAGTGTATLGSNQIDVLAQGIDIISATARNGALSLRASTGRATVDAATAHTNLLVNARTNATLDTGIATDGTIAILAGTNILSATSLTAGTDIAVRAGGDMTLRALKAGDDVDIRAGGTVTFAPALAGPTPYNVETTGLPSAVLDAQSVAFTIADAGLASGITLASGDTALIGSNIRIQAANLQPGLTGTNGTGLIVNSLSGGSFDIDATTGDVRLGTLTANTGNIDVDAAGSVTGLADGHSALSGGASFKTVGNFLLDVTGTASIGSVSAVDVRTQTSTPAALRIRDVTATGAVDLRTGSVLEIGTGTVTGAVILRTASGAAAALTDFDANPLVPNFGAANLSANAANALLTVNAGLAAQLGTVVAGAGSATLGTNQISVTAQGIDITSATARNGALSLRASTGRATLDNGAANTNLLVNAKTEATLDTGTATQGTIAILAGTNALSATSLTAGEDVSIRTGGDVTVRALKAGDDVDINAIGTLTFSPALAGPTPYNVETTGLGSDTRFASLGVPAAAGQVGAISVSTENPALNGSTIRIQAANLQPGLGGTNGTGLIVNNLAGGSFDIDAATGDVRLGTLTATLGDIAIDAAGSVTGLADGHSALSGGASFKTTGNFLLNVSGTASIGSISAVDIRTQTNAPTALRIRDITATGEVDLRTGSALEIGIGTITGAVTLRTASGAPVSLTDFNADPLAPGFGAANLFANATNASVTVGAGLAAQFGTVEAGGNITASAQGVDLARNVDTDHATAGGTISILARTGRAHLGRGTAGNDILLNAATNARFDIGITQSGSIAILAGGSLLSKTGTTDADNLASLTAGEDVSIRTGGDVTVRALKAGDDVDINTVGTVLFSPALAGPTPYNVETTGLGSGARLATFGTAGQVGAISFSAEDPTLTGSTIRVQAANLQPGLGGTNGTGLIVNNLTGGSFDIDAATGDVRLGTLTATLGDIAIDAAGSVTGLADGHSALSGGASFKTVGNLLLNVTGNAAIGSISAIDVRTQTNAPADLRIRSIIATGAVDLRTGSALEIGTGTVAGAVTLRTASGAPTALTDFNADTLAPGYGTANLFANTANAAVAVGAGLAAQLGTVEAGGSITVSAQGVDLAKDVDTDHATAGGAISVLATTGRARFGKGTAATNILLNAATDARLDIGLTQSGSIAILAGRDVTSQTVSAAPQDAAFLNAGEDIAISAGRTVTLRAVKAGDDVGITTPTGTLLFSPALAGPAPYNVETTGLGSGIRLAAFGTAGQVGAISFGTESVTDGSNIRIRAANIQPDLGGTNGTGLIVNNLGGGSFDVDATTGDVRLGTLTATSGNIDVDATGSVTGLATSYAAPTGGASFRTTGNLLLDVTGTASLGSISAVDVRTQTSTPAALRIRSVTASGALDLRTGSTLEIGTGTVTGAVTLRTASGTSETVDLTAASLAPGYDRANLSANTANALVSVTAGKVAKLGTVEAGAGTTVGTFTGAQIAVDAAAVDIATATARNGPLSILATGGGLTLGTGTAKSATLTKRTTTGILTVQSGLTTVNDILLDSEGDVAINAAVTASATDAVITLRNSGVGTAPTTIGESVTGGAFALNEAEVNRLNAGKVKIDSLGQRVTIGKLAVDADTGKDNLAFLTTGAVTLTGVLSGDGAGILQIGGTTTDAPPATDPINPATLASQIRADIGSSGTAAKIAYSNGTVDLRGQRIVFARTNLVDKYLSNISNAQVAQDVATAGSELYLADATVREFLTAKTLRVSYSDFALFQNTGGPLGAGVGLNKQSTPTTTHLALQLFNRGDRRDDSFILFGSINGFIGRAAGILPNGSLEIAAPDSNPRIVRITQANSRVNGCVIGSPDKGCLITDPPRPNFSIYDERQAQLFTAADKASLFVNPLIGRGNEGLIVEIADAPIGIDTIECNPNDAACAANGERK